MKLTTHIITLAVVISCAAISMAATKLVDAPVASTDWSSRPPAGCPFVPSPSMAGVHFTGRHAEYTHADTWYPSWAADDRMYSPFTDGSVNGVGSGSGGGAAVIGHAIIEGSAPLALKVVEPATISGKPAPYGGRYPCGSLHYNGIWYVGTYGLATAPYGLNWPIMGPCAGFHISADNGKTWTPSPLSCEPGRALFPEPERFKGPVKFGSPHFVDFGKNMMYSPDGKAYLVGHGSLEPDQKERKANLSWITGDQIYLCRVKPSPATINDATQYEYFAGSGLLGKPRWSHALSEAKPIAEWNNHKRCVTMTYNAPLKKYLMCITDGCNTTGMYDTYILESARMTGPWHLVTYLPQFGKEAYFVKIPSKFISADGHTVWLCYSANWAHQNKPEWINPPGSRYAMCLQEIALGATNDVAPPATALEGDDNLARRAVVTVSSVHSDYRSAGVVDGVVGGFPGDINSEWASNGDSIGAWVKLEWAAEQTVDRVWLFDRPNNLDQITAGTLSFSDGSTVEVGPLPDDARQGVEVSFPARKIRWAKFTITAVKPGSPNIGLSEIAVFRAN